MIRDIRLWPDPVLRRRALPVEAVDASIRALVNDMFETMYAAPGVGLAAPQIGVRQRVLVLDTRPRQPEVQPVAMINPRIVSTEGGPSIYREGCLSIPGLFFPIMRPKEILLTGRDLDGNEISIEADEIEARCFQHELDHLDGRLLLSLLDQDQRKEAMRELRRRAESVGG